MDAIAIVVIVIFVVYLGCSKHSVHEELEAAHADPAGNAVLVELYHAEIVALQSQEPTHVLKHAVRGLEKVDPGEEVEDEVALHVVSLLEHVQLRVRLADHGGVVVPLCVSGVTSQRLVLLDLSVFGYLAFEYSLPSRAS
jgi:hypothetical protein